MTGAICGGFDWAERRVFLCPTENRRRRFVGHGAHWYGTTWTCLGCGDRWSSDGERGERPFMRGWRARAIAEARRDWDQVPLYPTRRQAMDAFLADVGVSA